MPKNGDMSRRKSTGEPVMYMDGGWRTLNEGGMADMGGGFYKNQIGQVYRQGPQGGFSKVSGPTDTVLKEKGDAAININKSLGLLDQFDKAVRQVKTGPAGWVSNGDDLASVVGIANQLKLNLKEAYNLGVLNGGDEAILDAVVSNPGKLRDGQFFQKSVYPRLQSIASELGRAYRQQSQGLRNFGGNSDYAMNPLFQAKDSQYTPQQWGSEGSVPSNVFKGQTGPYLPKNSATQSGGQASQRKTHQTKYGIVYED